MDIPVTTAPKIDLDGRSAALVLIDLQKGILGRDLAPRSGEATLAAARDLAGRFRVAEAPVVLVSVGWARDFSDAPSQNVDRPIPWPKEGLPPEWSELADGLARPEDLLVRKRHWGAFHGTDLDLLLRRRGITTVVLGGVATNFGVESTARSAWEHGYDIVIVEDVCASASPELHEFAIENVFPRISRVAQSRDLRIKAV